MHIYTTWAAALGDAYAVIANEVFGLIYLEIWIVDSEIDTKIIGLSIKFPEVIVFSSTDLTIYDRADVDKRQSK